MIVRSRSAGFRSKATGSRCWALAVAQRTREIDVRMALGAGRARIARETVVGAMRPVLGGLAAGIVIALGLSRFVRGMLFDVGPHDPMSFFAAALVIVTVGLVAALAPAHGATRVDPIVAIRE